MSGHVGESEAAKRGDANNATIRDGYVPGSFFCSSSQLSNKDVIQSVGLTYNYMYETETRKFLLCLKLKAIPRNNLLSQILGNIYQGETGCNV